MDMQSKINRLNLRDILFILFRQKVVIVVCFIVIMSMVTIGLQLKTNIYGAESKLMVKGIKETGAIFYTALGQLQNTQIGLTESRIVQSRPVLAQVVSALELDQLPLGYEKDFATPLKKIFIEYKNKKFQKRMEELSTEARKEVRFQMALEGLKARVNVEPIRGTNLFSVKVYDYNPVMASLLANSISRSYIIFDLRQLMSELLSKYGRRHPSVQQIQDNIDTLTDTLNGIPIKEHTFIGPGTVEILEQAYPALKRKGTSKKSLMILAFALSLFLGFTLAFIFDWFDETVKSSDALESFLKMPFFGSIPKLKDKFNPLLYKEKDSLRRKLVYRGYVHAYAHLSDQIQLVLREKKYKSILIAATNRGEGVTACISNVGYFLAKNIHLKVLIVDVNFRDSQIRNNFNITSDKGMADVLQGQCSHQEVMHEIIPGLLTVIPSGTTEKNPLKLLNSQKIPTMMGEFCEQYDVVLVNSSQLNGNKEPIVVASFVDGVVLLVAENLTRKHVIENAIQPLRFNKDIHFLGALLNNRRKIIPDFVYKLI